jgi:SAM-dependent methyltransferase
MAEWHETYALPEPGSMMFGATDKARADFISIGTQIFQSIEREVLGHFGDIEPLRMLDFGCGNGRVALPFFHAYRKPTDCVDPNPRVIDFLRSTIPDAHPRQSSALPPLPFDTGAFDCVYAVSVWTHLPLHLQWPWLREINRVLKMGGLALITTSSYTPLKLRQRNANIPGWVGVTDDDLRLEGTMYKRADKALADNPGADPDWGYVLHDPQWVRAEWSRLFDYRACHVEDIAKMQDLHVMVKDKAIEPSDLDALVRA